jgi:multiple antibiotic resistance protein
MQEAAKNLLLVLVALFPIVDPLGGSPFFLALTREYAPEARKALSWRIAGNSFFLLVGSKAECQVRRAGPMSPRP